MAPDPYLDPATGVLRNKLDLADDHALHVAEAGATRLNAAAAVAYADGVRHLNEAALKRIHLILFGELYD